MSASRAVGGDGRPIIWTVNLSSFAAFTSRLVARVENWPSVLARLVLSSLHMSQGDIVTVVRGGPTIVAPPSRPAWWPCFEMFVEDVYRLSELRDVELTTGDVVLDLGAHIGTSAVLFARRWPEATVVAVEPNPKAFSYMRRNVAANGVRAELVQAAVGAADGRTTLYGLDDASCEATTSARRPGATSEVPVLSFGRLVHEAPGRMRIVKLDCEGAEHEVLAASSPELWADVEVVLLEYHRTSDPASSWEGTKARVERLGFETVWQEPFDWYPGLGMAAFRRPGYAATSGVR